jgi:ribosome-binding protein aMBF1 (putative translation factor)
MPADSPFPRPPVPLPTRRPASTDPGRFASRLRSAPPRVLDPGVGEVAASVSRSATSAQDYREQVGRRVRLARVSRDLTQDEVAQRAGVTRNFVSAIERGVQGVDAWRMNKLAGALGVSLSWLLGHSDSPDR